VKTSAKVQEELGVKEINDETTKADRKQGIRMPVIAKERRRKVVQ
jgi:hypothetical protein